MMKKNVRNIEINEDQQLSRDFRISFSLNEKEYNAVSRYLDKYRINNHTRWYRETIMMFVLQKLEEDHPKLFDEHQMRR